MTTSYLRVKETYARTIVVGDIHGCMDELRLLLEKVSFGPEDLLVTVGDMVDRGPATWEVARFFRDSPNALSVLGNHDRRVANSVRGTSQPEWAQRQSLSLLGKDEHEDWATWLEALPAVVETEHVIVTHARIDPVLPLDRQDPYHTCAVGWPRVVIEKDADGVPLWFRSLNPERPVCVGHLNYDRIVLVPGRLFALDTACVHAGMLTAAIFPHGQTVSVPAARNYFEEALSAWKRDAAIPFHDKAPAEWPLSAVADLLKREPPPDDPEHLAARTGVMSLFDSLEVEKRAPFLRAALLVRFGEVPNPDPEKGSFYIRVKKSFPRKEHADIAVALLRSASFDLPLLAHLCPKLPLGKVNELLNALKNEISRSRE
jgi:hypothetical protein